MLLEECFFFVVHLYLLIFYFVLSTRYDTRSEVASSVTSDSDSGDGMSSKSFDVKRKRHTKTFSSHVSTSLDNSRKNDSISPLKRNTDEYISKLNFLFRDARFFIIKSSNPENIVLSKEKGVWATLPQNQIKLSEAFRSSENVILVFSAKESGKFSGFARLATCVDRSISPVPWVVPAELTLNLLKGTFRIDWICRNDLPFTFTTSLYNPWNCNKPVKIARDGQEVEPRVGEKLCRLFPEDEGVDLAPILRKSKEAAKSRALKAGSADGAAKALYTAKYRMKMLHQPHPHHPRNHSSKEGARKTFGMHRIHDGGRVAKPYKRGGLIAGMVAKDGPLRGRVVTSIETYVKRFGHHGFRPPPLPPPPPGMAMPYMPGPPHPHPPGGDMFGPQFAHLPPFPPPLPRYYEPVPPPHASFAHFSKMNPLHAAAAAAAASKNMYDRSVEEFLRKTREKEYYSKKEARSKRKEPESSSKSRRSRYRR